MLDVSFGQATDSGRVRPHNEDAVGAIAPRSDQEARTHGWIFAVADGVGGLDLGEVASAKAIEIVTGEFLGAPSTTPLGSLLPDLIQKANCTVHDEGLLTERRGRNMATTIAQEVIGVLQGVKPNNPVNDPVEVERVRRELGLPPTYRPG